MINDPGADGGQGCVHRALGVSRAAVPVAHRKLRPNGAQQPDPALACGCGKGFIPRRGKPQVFCRVACRRAFDAAGRRWVADAITAGMLTIDALRNGAATTRALLSGAVSTASLPEPQKPAPVAPAERPGEAAELLSALLAVPSEGWHALAAAMSQELFDGLKHWQGRPTREQSVAVSERHPVIATVARAAGYSPYLGPVVDSGEPCSFRRSGLWEVG